MRKSSLARLLAVAAAVAGGALYGVASAGAATVYDTVPSPLPGNLPSMAFEATATSQFGGQIELAGADRNATSLTVVMSSWGCESGNWFSGNCSTTPGATFSEPITLTFYSVGSGGAVGSSLGSTTQTFEIPYRPSASASCGDGRWSDGTTCFNGYATPITFDLTGLGLTLPDTVIVGIAYDTTHYGAAPIGESAPCYTSSGGCGYDSLNVALVDPAAITPVGTVPAPDDAYLDSTWGGAYCDGGASGTGTFRLDAGCWTGYQPAISLTAEFGSCPVHDDAQAKTLTLLADCTTDHTLAIPGGYTLDGAGHTITAVDPSGGHFLGAVLANGGTTASVENVVVTASGLSNVCDPSSPDTRLRGILLDNADGSITNVTVHGVRQGASGCQEGNAIEVRNFTDGAPQRSVTISGNHVFDYQKNGITVNGNVAAFVTGNVVAGDGPITYIAQNGIQVGFGATADVSSNTVTGNDYTPAAYVACGILVYQATGVHQSKNALSANERDFCNFGRGGGQFNPEG